MKCQAVHGHTKTRSSVHFQRLALDEELRALLPRNVVRIQVSDTADTRYNGCHSFRTSDTSPLQFDHKL